MLKLTKSYLIYTTILLSSACSKKPVIFPIVTMALPNNEESTILIRSSGTGKNITAAVDDAERKAFNTLLFYGYPSSVQSRPLIDNKADAIQKNPTYFNDFFDKKTYKNFIVYSNNFMNEQKSQNTYYLVRQLKINLRILRTDLENNGIIRKFGF